MSGETSDTTEFVSGCEGAPSRCRACGAKSYRPTKDGPRCTGCRRWVERDDRAEIPDDLGAVEESPEPRREGLRNRPRLTPEEARRRADEVLGQSATGEDLLVLRDLIMGKKPEPPAPKAADDGWSKEAMWDEVGAILREGRS